MKQRHRFVSFMIAFGFATMPAAHAAQKAADVQFPERPVRMVAASAPGGGIDIISRLTAQPLAARWGQQVVVDNRGGGGGTIAVDIVARSDPDGYTLLTTGPGITYAAELHKKLPFDVKRDIAPVAFLATQPFVLVVHPSVQAQSVRDLVAAAKSRPGQIRYGSGGVGGASHLATELFRSTAGIDIVHVPYKGTGPGMTGLLTGEVQMLVVGVPTAQPHVAAGKIRALALTGARRLSNLPDTPTIAESGLPGAEVDIWVALFAPAKTPRAIVNKINRDVNAVLGDAQVKRTFDGVGAVPHGGSVEDFTRYIAAETAKWTKTIRAAGIRAE